MGEALIRIAVAGAAGRMGREVVRALTPDHGFAVVAATDRTHIGTPLAELVPGAPSEVRVAEDLDAALAQAPADVLIDFSHASAVLGNASVATSHGAAFVIGATGVPAGDVDRLRELTQRSQRPGMLIPNFAIGAVLMIRFAELAARWLPDVEIIELHHERKEDAPSGTAMLTAQRVAVARRLPTSPKPEAKLKAEGALGGDVDGVPVHSVRLPGLLAHQMVLFGGTGETLTLRHDSLDRTSFMPGVRLAAREVRNRTGLTIGLDALLFEGDAGGATIGA